MADERNIPRFDQELWDEVTGVDTSLEGGRSRHPMSGRTIYYDQFQQPVTEKTVSFEIDGEHVVVPSIWDGKILRDNDEIIRRALESGEMYGRGEGWTAEEADAFSRKRSDDLSKHFTRPANEDQILEALRPTTPLAETLTPDVPSSDIPPAMDFRHLDSQARGKEYDPFSTAPPVDEEMYGSWARDHDAIALLGDNRARTLFWLTKGGSPEDYPGYLADLTIERLRNDALPNYTGGNRKEKLERLNSMVEGVGGLIDLGPSSEAIEMLPEDAPERHLADIERIRPALFNANDNPYRVHGAEIYFDPNRMKSGIESALRDGIIDQDQATELMETDAAWAAELEAKFGPEQLAIIRAVEKKALAYGVTKGVGGWYSFAASAKLWGKTAGKAAGKAAGRVPYVGPILGPTVEQATGIAAGWAGSLLAEMTIDEATDLAADYYEFAAEFAASRDIHPSSVETGQFIGFAVPAASVVLPGAKNMLNAYQLSKASKGGFGRQEIAKLAGQSVVGGGIAFGTIKGLEELAVATGVAEAPPPDADHSSWTDFFTMTLLSLGFQGKNLKFSNVRVTPREVAEHWAYVARGEKAPGGVPGLARGGEKLYPSAGTRLPQGSSPQAKQSLLRAQAIEVWTKKLGESMSKWRQANPNATREEALQAFKGMWGKLPSTINVQTVSLGDALVAGRFTGSKSAPAKPSGPTALPITMPPPTQAGKPLAPGSGKPQPKLPTPVEETAPIKTPPSQRKALPEAPPRPPIVTPPAKRPELPGPEALWSQQLKEGRTPGQINIQQRAEGETAKASVQVAEAEKPLELWSITKNPSGVQAGSEIVAGKATTEATEYALDRSEEPAVGTTVKVDRVDEGVVYGRDKAGNPVAVDTALTEVMVPAPAPPDLAAEETDTAPAIAPAPAPAPAKVGNPVYSTPEVEGAEVEGVALQPDIWSVSKADTGTPVELTTYRGEGREDIQSVYAEGAEGPALGKGEYSAIDQESASKFGPNVQKQTVRLENPYVLESDEQLRDLAGLSPDAALPREVAEWNPVLAKVRQAIEDKGHDGVVVNVRRYRDFDSDAGIENVKRLREVFGESQVIKFASAAPVKAPTPQEAAVEAVRKRGEELSAPVAEAAPADPVAEAAPVTPKAPAKTAVSKTEPTRTFTTHSGMGTMEAGLTTVTHRGAVELEETIVFYYNLQHGTKFEPRDVLDLTPAEVAEAKPDLFHASPECKNLSAAKKGRGIEPQDIAHAEKVAEIIREARPPSVTVENVTDYFNTKLSGIIIEALIDAGYDYRIVNVNAADYGAAQSRRRTFVQAVRKDVGSLPDLPEKSKPGDWYELLKDLIDSAPDSELRGKKKGSLSWERARLDDMIEKGKLDPSKPIFTAGGSAQREVTAASNAGNPSPTLLATAASIPRILMPDGRIKRVTPRMMARLMGLSDDVKIPEAAVGEKDYIKKWGLAKTVLGNGIHTLHTRNLIEPVAEVAKRKRQAQESPATFVTPQEAAVTTVRKKSEAKKQSPQKAVEPLKWKAKGKGEWRSSDGRFKIKKGQDIRRQVPLKSSIKNFRTSVTKGKYRLYGTRGPSANKPIAGLSFDRLADAKSFAELYLSGGYKKPKPVTAKPSKKADSKKPEPIKPKFDLGKIQADRRFVESLGVQQTPVGRSAPKVKQWVKSQGGAPGRVPATALTEGVPLPDISSYEDYLNTLYFGASRGEFTAWKTSGRNLMEVAANQLAPGDTFGISGFDYHVIERVTAGEIALAFPEFDAKQIMASQLSQRDFDKNPIRPGEEYLVVSTANMAFVVPVDAKVLMAEGLLKRDQPNPFAEASDKMDRDDPGNVWSYRTPTKIGSAENKAKWEEMVRPQPSESWPAEALNALTTHIIDPQNELAPSFRTVVSDWVYKGEYKGTEKKAFPLSDSDTVWEFAHPTSGRSVLLSGFGWVASRNGTLHITMDGNDMKFISKLLNERPILAELREPRPLHGMGAMANPGGAFKTAKERAESMRANGETDTVDTPSVERVREVITDQESRKRYEKSTAGIEGHIKAREKYESQGKGFVNSFVEGTLRGATPKLPRGRGGAAARYAIAHDRIDKMPAQFAIANRDARQAIQDIVGHLNREEYELFNLHLLFQDLVESIKIHGDRGEESEYPLPYGLTEAAVKQHAQEFAEMVNGNINIKAAVEHRKDVFGRVKDFLIDAGVRAGFPELESILNREDYYQHQNIELRAEAMRAEWEGRPGVKLPSGRGEYKMRKGSLADINSNYAEVEFASLRNMMFDATFMDAIADIRAEYDISRALKARAEKFNKALEEEAANRGVKVNPKDYHHWTQYIGEYPGYELWHLKGSTPMMGKNTNGQAVALDTFEKLMGHHFNLTDQEMAEAQAMDDSANVILIPTPLAEQFRYMEKAHGHRLKDANKFSKANQLAIQGYKRWLLLSPKAFAGYNIRNLGEAEKAVWAAPQSFKYFPRAITDLLAATIHKPGSRPKISQDLADWMAMGGGQELFVSGELPDVKAALDLQTGVKQGLKGYLSQKPTEIAVDLAKLGPWWKAAGKVTGLRESILRYQTYLHFLDAIRADRDLIRQKYPDMKDYQGRPPTFAGSIPEEVMAMKTPQEMAWKLSNEMFINYGDASPATQALARHAAPFIRFHTGNNMYYFRYIRNAVTHEKVLKQVAEQIGLPPGAPPPGGRGGTAAAGSGRGRRYAKVAGMVGSKGFQFYLLARLNLLMTMWGANALAYVWNNLLMSHIEEQLPDYQRETFHINLWQGEDGKNHIFIRGATSPEFQSSLGMDSEFLPRGLRMLSGEVTPGEFASTSAKTFLNHWGQMKGPYISLAYAAMGLDPYPDILNPRTVRDRTAEIFDAIGMGEEYSALMGKPSRWTDRYIGGEDFIIQTYAPGENSYNRIRDEVREYRTKVMEKYGYEGGIVTGKRADALYYMKKAIRFKDPDQAEYFMLEYVSTFIESKNGKKVIDLKAVNRALKQSERMRSPLGALSKEDTIRMTKEKPGFLLSLVPEKDREAYAKSLPSNFYSLSHENKVRAMVENLPEPHRRNIQNATKYYDDFIVTPTRQAGAGATKRLDELADE